MSTTVAATVLFGSTWMNTCPCVLSHFLTPTLTKDQASALPTELPSERTWGRKTLKGRTLHLHGSFPSAETPSSLSPPMRGPSDPVIYRTDLLNSPTLSSTTRSLPAIMKRAVWCFFCLHANPLRNSTNGWKYFFKLSCRGWKIGSVVKNTNCPFREPLVSAPTWSASKLPWEPSSGSSNTLYGFWGRRAHCLNVVSAGYARSLRPFLSTMQYLAPYHYKAMAL